MDQKVSLLYSPVTDIRSGKGELLLLAPSSGGKEGDASAQWVIGRVKNGDGETIGTIVSSLSPEDLLRDAFNQEFTTAGYTVTQVSKLPQDVHRGIAVSKISLAFEDEWSLPRDKASAILDVAVEIWKDGRKIRLLSYESRVSDVAFRDRKLLAQQLLEKGLHEIMRQAVPEIVTSLEM
ncbi:hypothetical protein [Geobacter sp. AOG1]|uniref:hypothetical protein n=1 Tax=Geobacter sp. AOG1 TaxID=1566346 RepID=UPI001CC3575F|nr:hypothetical protein [Geobacter sp. AOG1]